MDTPTSSSSKKIPPKLLSCPYIGMLSDPQTHVSVADSRNHCHLVDPPRSVTLPHQESFCLRDHFPACEVYIAGTGFSDADAAAAVAQTAAASMTVALPVEDAVKFDPPADQPFSDEDFRKVMYAEAMNRYDQVGTKKRERNWWWVVVVVAFLILAGAVYGVMNRMQRLRLESQIAAENAYSISLATAVQDMGAAADAWATAASAYEAEAARQTAQAIAAATQAAQAAIARATQDALSALTANQTATAELIPCTELGDAAYGIIAGPSYSPTIGSAYRQGTLPPTPTASWKLLNTGSCAWQKVKLLATANEELIQPIIRLNGVTVVAPALGIDEAFTVKPGEQIEIALEFDPNQVRKVEGEWALVVNDLTLTDFPILRVAVENWLQQISSTPEATSIFRRPPLPRETGPATRPEDTPPPGRP